MLPETMKKYSVIFDTNSYRNFVTNKSTDVVIADTKKLVQKGKTKNIKAFGSIIVALEMLGHLVEGESGFNYKDCLNGVISLGNHCLENPQKGPRILPHSYLQIAKSFFKQSNSQIEQRVKNLGGVINDFIKDPETALNHHNPQNTFEDIKNYLDSEELSFSNQIINLIKGVELEIKTKYPKIAKKDLRNKMLDYIEKGPFESFISMAIIYAVSINLNIKLTEEQIIDRAFNLNLEFPLSVGFFTWICKEIVDKNIDMQSKTSKQKRWNWLWDYHVSYAMSNNTLDQGEIILVTADQDMIDIITHHGYTNKVMDLDEYLNFIDFNDD
jgi:hypothetical protein